MNFDSLFLRLAHERKRLGLTQAEAGDACGVSREMWSRYEKDKASMGCDVLALFAAAGADVNYILTGVRVEVSPAPASPGELTSEQSARLQLAIEAVEEGLLLIKRKLTPEKKARVILAAFDLLSESETAKSKVVELIRLVA